jgi:hypothetical protein
MGQDRFEAVTRRLGIGGSPFCIRQFITEVITMRCWPKANFNPASAAPVDVSAQEFDFGHAPQRLAIGGAHIACDEMNVGHRAELLQCCRDMALIAAFEHEIARLVAHDLEPQGEIIRSQSRQHVP